MFAGAVGLSRAFRRRRNTYFKQVDQIWRGLRIVSDGDSWFQFPRPRIKDVIDHLDATGRYAISCGAVAGTEFDRIFADRKRLIHALERDRADVLLLSGGGNDILGYGRIVNFVHAYDPAREPRDYPNDRLASTIKNIVSTFEDLITDALRLNPKLAVFCHGYDRALPKRNGPWLNVPLAETCKITNKRLQASIVTAVIDEFNVRMKEMVGRLGSSVQFVDCRGAVEGPEDWYDELHPNNAGFKAVAARFDRAIRRQFRRDPRLLEKRS